MLIDDSPLKVKKQQSIVSHIILFQVTFITVAFVATIAGLWWTTHHFIVEEGLKERAMQLAPELNKSAARLYLSDNNSDALAELQSQARNTTDILFVRYYNAKDMKLLGQYVKDTQTQLPDSPSAQIAKLNQPNSEPVLLTTQTLGVVTSIRLLAPVHILPNASDGKLITGVANQHKQKIQAIGYVELAVDLAPTKKNLFKSIFPVSALLLTILVSFVIFSRRYIHNALNILLDSHNPLQRLANEDFNVADKSKLEKYGLKSTPETELASESKNQFLARILIADDNEINRKLAVILLSHIGANIDQAENGFEAVTACNHNSYDLILMDIHMPVMDGIEATKQIRLLQQDGSRTPIVALTANALNGDKERYIASGMDDYLAKPLTEVSLQRVLIKWCPAAFQKHDSVIDTEKTITTKAPPPSDLPVLDPKQGIALAFGQVETWKTVLEMLLKSLPTLLNDIERAFDAKRMDEMHQFVHKLHGSSSYCGTPALQQASQSLEIACISNNIDEIALQLNQVKIEMVALANLVELNGIPTE